MQKLSEIFSKQIISLSSGKIIGYLLNVQLNEHFNGIKSLIIVENESEQEALIDVKSIKAIGDGIFIGDESQIEYNQEFSTERVIGKEVYLANGTCLGRVTDLILNNFKIESFVMGRGEFSAKNISLFGENIIILGEKKQKKSKKIEKNDIFSPKSFENQVLISALNQPNENVQPSPYRISTEPRNLIGKMLTRDIYGLNNEIIAKKFQIINQKIINDAKKHQKLNLLFYYCK